MILTEAEKRALAAILEYADDRMSAAGCNDFNLAEVMPHVEERRAIMRTVHEVNGDPEEFDANAEYKVVMDFQVLAYLRHILGI